MEPIFYNPRLVWNDPVFQLYWHIYRWQYGRPYDERFPSTSSSTQAESNQSKCLTLYKKDEWCVWLHAWCLAVWACVAASSWVWPYILQSAPLMNNLIISQWPACIIYTTKGEWQCQNTPESMVSSLAPASKGFSLLFEGRLMIKFTLPSWPFWLNLIKPTTSTSASDIKSPVNWLICVPITWASTGCLYQNIVAFWGILYVGQCAPLTSWRKLKNSL